MIKVTCEVVLNPLFRNEAVYEIHTELKTEGRVFYTSYLISERELIFRPLIDIIMEKITYKLKESIKYAE